MKGIYLTQEGKEFIEAKIIELETKWKGKVGYGMILYQIDTLKEILSSATLLPLEGKYAEYQYQDQRYPDGLIIDTKK